MSVRAYYDVWCDIDGRLCVGWAEGATSSGRHARRDARRAAKELGWSLIRSEGKLLDVCPACRQERVRGVLDEIKAKED